jgi:hypothetical protein
MFRPISFALKRERIFGTIEFNSFKTITEKTRLGELCKTYEAQASKELFKIALEFDEELQS